MASFEQAASFAARRAADSVKERFSPEERQAAIERIEEEELLFLPMPDTIKTKLLNMCRENKVAALSAAVLAVMAVAIIFADKLTSYDPNAVNLMERLLPPSKAHWCGTDDLGRDIFTRILYGGRVSLLVGVIPTAISMALGVVLGMISGYIRQTEAVIMRLADIVLAFPSIVLAMVVMYTLGATTTNIFIALSMIGWAKTARVVRSQTLSLREQEFVEAARGMGVKKWTIMFRHILPNCLPSLIVLFTLNIPDAILSEANLSFLGVGTQPPDSSWGLMVSQARTFAQSSPWMLIFPSLAILIMVLALNFLGDGLRDVMDPHGR